MRISGPLWIPGLLAGCASVAPVTPALWDDLAGSAEAPAAQDFRVLGQFELHAAGRAMIVVKHHARALEVVSRDDTTLVATVLGAEVSGLHDTLRLTFVESAANGGAYTLRAINGAPLGGSIPVGIVAYQYVPCARNFGLTCNQPIRSGAREDQEVRLGVMK